MQKAIALVAVAALLLLCAGEASALVVNLARLGTASQSSNGAGTVASRGNDGGLGPAFATDKTTTHTVGEAFSWWEVDLGATYELSLVELFSRGDCCSPLRLGDFRVSVLDSPGGTVLHSEHFSGDVPQKSVQPFALPDGLLGRVVQVQIVGENGGLNDGLNNAGNGILSLREVRVFGEADVAPNANLAGLFGVATQSTTRAGSGGNAAQFAIDGSTNGNFNSGSVTHTNTETAPWWQVDLGDEFELQDITLWNRTDGGLQSRMNAARVSVLNGSLTEVWNETIVGYPDPDLMLSLPRGTIGQYVRVELAGGGRVLSLAEVQVRMTPEPATLSLLGVGALALLRRRRKS